MIQTLTMLQNENEDFKLSDVINIAALADFGPLGLENSKRYSVHEIAVSSGDYILAVINYKAASNTYVQSKVGFQKEDDKWKMNYPATLSYFEKYLTKLYRQTGGTESDFIQGVIVNGGKDVEMKYRK